MNATEPIPGIASRARRHRRVESRGPGRRVARGPQVVFGVDDSACPEAEIERAGALQAAQQQARSDEQHQRAGDLEDDERVAHTRAAQSAARDGAVHVQRPHDVGRGGLERGEQTEHQSPERRQSERVSEHADVRLEVERDRPRKRREPHAESRLQYFCEHPIVPPGRIAANLNVDGINIWGRTSDVAWSASASRRSTTSSAPSPRRRGARSPPTIAPTRARFYRSDQFNFAKLGVPAIYLKSGILHPGHDAAWGRALKEKYDNERYHQPNDQIDETWNLDGAVDDVQLMTVTLLRVADAPKLPEWRKGDEFEAARKKAAEPPSTEPWSSSSISTSTIWRAAAFYTTAFDLSVARQLGADGVELVGGSRIPTPASPGTMTTDATGRRVHLDFLLDDVESAVARAVAAGAALERPTTTLRLARTIAGLADPWGHGLCLLRASTRGYDRSRRSALSERHR